MKKIRQVIERLTWDCTVGAGYSGPIRPSDWAYIGLRLSQDPEFENVERDKLFKMIKFEWERRLNELACP